MDSMKEIWKGSYDIYDKRLSINLDFYKHFEYEEVMDIDIELEIVEINKGRFQVDNGKYTHQVVFDKGISISENFVRSSVFYFGHFKENKALYEDDEMEEDESGDEENEDEDEEDNDDE